MTTIGSFTATHNGYTGIITALTVSAPAVFQPTQKKSEKAPDFRIYSHGAEIGAAWRRTSKTDKPYLSVKLDDPSFEKPIYARLVNDSDEKSKLIWSR